MSDTEQREAAFWDEHVPALEQCLALHAAGPDELTTALLGALEPLAGLRVLDFACGAGVLSAWLAGRGAHVVGLDVSAASVARAAELAAALGLERARFVQGTVSELEGEPPFDRICGRFALHHTDVAATAPRLAAVLAPAGRGAFLETIGRNPLLVTARRLSGRFGVPRYGTEDERPLRSADLDALRAAFGELRVTVPQVVFLRLFDRQVLDFRYRRVSSALAVADDVLGRVGLGMLSHQVLVLVG